MTNSFIETYNISKIRKILPYVVFLLLIVLTIFLWKMWYKTELKREQARYDYYTDAVIHEIENNMRYYMMVLQGGGGLFSSSTDVSREDWHKYCEYRKIREHFPGIQGIGYAKVIKTAELAQHIKSIRSDGFKDYIVKPTGNRNVYAPVVYLEPFDARNQRAFGYDMFSETIRRTAMEYARDSGLVANSGKVKLIQETGKDIQPGFLMYLPIYKKNMPLKTKDDRIAAIEGYVYSAFRMNDFMKGVFPYKIQNIEFKIYDGKEISQASLIYKYKTDNEYPNKRYKPLFSDQKTLNLYGQQWTFLFNTTQSFDTDIDRYTSNGILIIGFFFSLLSFFFILSMENIRERAILIAKDMTNAFKESEEKYRILNDSLSIGVSIIDQDMKIIASNATKQKWFPDNDYQYNLVCYEAYNIPPGTEPCNNCPVMQTFRDGKIHNVEREAVTAQGLRTLHIKTVPIIDNEGKIRNVHETVEDITERKQAEKALKQSEEQYHSMFSSMLEGVCIIELLFDDANQPFDYRFIDYNPAFKTQTGMIDAKGKTMREIAPEHEQYWFDIYGKVALTGERVRFINEAKALHRWYDVSAYKIGEENCRKVAVFFNDITDSKKAEEDRISRKAAEEASYAKSQFIANMSHEIRTPMNSILGFAQLLERDSSLTSKQAEYVRTISRSGTHLLRLINDILDISKIEAGKATLNLTVFYLRDLLDDIEIMFRSRTDAKGLQFIVERDESVLRYVKGDESKLRQIIVNLIGNATKFTERGGIALRIRIEDVNNDKETIKLVVEVEDTGIGILDEDVSRIFGVFQQADTGVKDGGTGLGLAISRKFVEMMGGELSVTSVMGTGSCFRFHVLLEKANEIVKKEEYSSRIITGIVSDKTEPYRILIVDDIQVNRTLLCELLQPLGFEIKEACDGIQALEICSEWIPHLILMDMRMPHMDGYETTRRLKASKIGCNIPVIAVTASAFDDSRKEVMAAGVDAYLRKPFRSEELFKILKEILDLQYIYSEGDNTEHKEKSSAATATVANLPEEMVNSMKNAIYEGDMVSLIEFIKLAENIDYNFAICMQMLADQYDYQALSRLLEKGGK